MTAPFPRNVLMAFGQKAATQDQVMRALMLSADWYAPLESLTHHGTPIAAHGIVTFTPESVIPAGELWLFSDREAARRAADSGLALGAYAAGLTAIEVFGEIDARYSIIKINPGGPLEESWFMPSDAFPFARIWAEAVAIEKALAAGDPASQPALLTMLGRFEGYLTLVHAENAALVGLPDRGGYRKSAVVFTSGDSFDRFIASLDPGLRTTLKLASGKGIALLEEVQHQGFDSIAFNPLGPGTSAVVPISIVAAVVRSRD